MKIPEKPKSYLTFGSTIHKVLEQLTKMQKNKQPIDETIAWELLDKFWDTKSYAAAVKEKKDYAEAKKLLKTFIDDQNTSTTEILDIEREFKTTIGTVHIRRVFTFRETTGFFHVFYRFSGSLKEHAPYFIVIFNILRPCENHYTNISLYM